MSATPKSAAAMLPARLYALPLKSVEFSKIAFSRAMKKRLLLGHLKVQRFAAVGALGCAVQQLILLKYGGLDVYKRQAAAYPTHLKTPYQGLSNLATAF